MYANRPTYLGCNAAHGCNEGCLWKSKRESSARSKVVIPSHILGRICGRTTHDTKEGVTAI
ncbi:hypothetical protein F751_6013 [Auxenochlorella protothecoides]|uniref:Uncharacterized protein n=1 Tax=Auxenochlorella protothecoides TaxID=3075 RepID=A0A087SCK5_AUXPR|nr:hypothetical protein F751_6013 [Auxenochlorella protothecoides]KFM23459.1 hypothetical protein F751_6013 [Auxenochlorella protothecoides]